MNAIRPVIKSVARILLIWHVLPSVSKDAAVLPDYTGRPGMAQNATNVKIVPERVRFC